MPLLIFSNEILFALFGNFGDYDSEKNKLFKNYVLKLNFATVADKILDLYQRH